MSLEMPEDLKGDYLKSSGFVKSNPRKWTPEELEWCLDAKSKGFSNAEIAAASGRTEVSVFVKLKRLSKSEDTYNEKHREIKYEANEEFFNLIKPRSVLDVYAGNSWYKNRLDNLVTNDKDKKFATNYHEDAFRFLSWLFLKNKKFDLIDLDPYGSAYESFDLALRLARKGIIISFGEWGHKRWKRFDYVSPRYGIETLEDFIEEPFIKEFQRLARIRKKIANPEIVLQYGTFLRVYFSLETFKETSQWEKEEK